jgi:ribA/ribD-fused uncharacterized protein
MSKRTLSDRSSVSSPEQDSKQTRISDSPINEHPAATLSLTIGNCDLTPQTENKQINQLVGVLKQPEVSMEGGAINFDVLLAGNPELAILGKALQQSFQTSFQTVNAELSSIKDSIVYTNKNVAEVKHIANTNTVAIRRLEDITTELARENKLLFKKTVDLESRSRRNNLKFRGDNILKYKKDETSADLIKWLHTTMVNNLGYQKEEIVFEIERIHRYGPEKNIILKFLRFRDRELMFAQRTKLKGSGIVMMEDFPDFIERQRRQLTPIMMAAQHQKMNAFLAIDKLIIKNENVTSTFTVDNLHMLPSCLNPEIISLRYEEDFIFFFGRVCPLSNFYLTKFVIQGKEYNCAEQYLQSEKAKLFGNHQVADQIMQENEPDKQKALGRTITNFDINKWKPAAKIIITEALTQKFSQNRRIQKILLETGKKTLVECSGKDILFGIGMKMSDKNKCDTTLWQGENLQGVALSDVRSFLSSQSTTTE